MRKHLGALVVIVLILLYVPHAGTSAQKIQHELGGALTSVGHAVGQFLDGAGNGASK